MNIFDRFILGLYAFAISVFSAVIILVSTNIISYSTVEFYSQTIINSREYTTIMIILASVFFLISIRFLLSGPKNSRLGQAIKKKSELGDIMISINSIQNIVMNVVKEIDGVMEQKIVVQNHKDDVKIKIKATVTPEMSIPDLSKKIQLVVKNVVESIVGAQVRTIEVFVDNVVQPIKPRVKVNNQVQAE